MLAAGHNANLEWLQSLPDNCRKRIRRLHIRFRAKRYGNAFDPKKEASILRAESIEDDDFEDPGAIGSGCCLICNTSGWDAFITYITTQLNLTQLHLAVDLGHIYGSERFGYAYTTMTPAIAKRAVHRVSRPLITQLRGRIKSLFMFLPIHFELESSIEKSVKGAEYDASQFGKIPPELRCYWRPFAMPGSRLGKVSDPSPARPLCDSVWGREPWPKLWGMVHAAQGAIRMSHFDDFDISYSPREAMVRLRERCITREICNEEIELVVKYRLPTGEIIIKEF